MSQPHFNYAVPFSEDLLGISMDRTTITLDQPIYVGLTILDLSKTLMYRFMFNVLQPLFGSNMELMYTDTDSFYLELSGSNIREKLASVKNDWLDLSNYPPSHAMYDPTNKGRLGCFKDECVGRPIREAIFIRPKVYSLAFHTGDGDASEEKKKAKGVKKSAVAVSLRHSNYMASYNICEKARVNFLTFRSKRHVINTVQEEKMAVSMFDNKRHWISKNRSIPFGLTGREQPKDDREQPEVDREQPKDGREQSKDDREQPKDGREQPKDDREQPKDDSRQVKRPLEDAIDPPPRRFRPGYRHPQDSKKITLWMDGKQSSSLL